jgi:hypothetical protein
MVKTLQYAGLETALVLLGWLCFFAGFVIDAPSVNIALQTVARVLPQGVLP